MHMYEMVLYVLCFLCSLHLAFCKTICSHSFFHPRDFEISSGGFSAIRCDAGSLDTLTYSVSCSTDTNEDYKLYHLGGDDCTEPISTALLTTVTAVCDWSDGCSNHHNEQCNGILPAQNATVDCVVLACHNLFRDCDLDVKVEWTQVKPALPEPSTTLSKLFGSYKELYLYIGLIILGLLVALVILYYIYKNLDSKNCYFSFKNGNRAAVSPPLPSNPEAVQIDLADLEDEHRLIYGEIPADPQQFEIDSIYGPESLDILTRKLKNCQHAILEAQEAGDIGRAQALEFDRMQLETELNECEKRMPIQDANENETLRGRPDEEKNDTPKENIDSIYGPENLNILTLKLKNCQHAILEAEEAGDIDRAQALEFDRMQLETDLNECEKRMPRQEMLIEAPHPSSSSSPPSRTSPRRPSLNQSPSVAVPSPRGDRTNATSNYLSGFEGLHGSLHTIYIGRNSPEGSGGLRQRHLTDAPSENLEQNIRPDRISCVRSCDTKGQNGEYWIGKLDNERWVFLKVQKYPIKHFLGPPTEAYKDNKIFSMVSKQSEYDAHVAVRTSNCPHIVRLIGKVKPFKFHDVTEESALVFPFYPEGSLDTYLRQNAPLKVLEILEIVKQVVTGLTVMHENRYVHRDIHPANILMKNENNCWIFMLADLGLARTLDWKHSGDRSLLNISAPESISNTDFSVASDVWMVGLFSWTIASAGHVNGNTMLNREGFPSPFGDRADETVYDHVTDHMKDGNGIIPLDFSFRDEYEHNDTDIVYELILGCCKFDPSKRLRHIKSWILLIKNRIVFAQSADAIREILSQLCLLVLLYVT